MENLMLTRLTKNLDSDAERELKQEYLASRRYRKRVEEILDEEIFSLHESMLNEENFSSPNWNLQQIDKLAQIKSLRKLQTFLK